MPYALRLATAIGFIGGGNRKGEWSDGGVYIRGNASPKIGEKKFPLIPAVLIMVYYNLDFPIHIVARKLKIRHPSPHHSSKSTASLCVFIEVLQSKKLHHPHN